MEQNLPQIEMSADAQKIVGQLSAMAMVDSGFKDRLTAKPGSVLAEHGLEMPEDMKIEVLKSFDEVPDDHSPRTLYLVIPEADALSHEELSIAQFAAKSCQSTASTACTTPSCGSSASSASTQSCH